MSAYQGQVKTYIDSQKTSATVGDVLGTQKIIAKNQLILLGSLPYKTVAIANAFQSLPDNLKWKFKTNIYAADGIGDGSSPLIELNKNTSSLAGAKITLSFVPATKGDQDLVSSYLPKPHADGTPIQPNELPSSLPGYLLHLKAEFRLDGKVIAQTTQSFSMGSTVKQSNQYFNPANGAWDGGDDNDIIVGEYNAIGIDLQGIGAQQLNNLQTKMAETKAKLMKFQNNSNDTTSINGLSKEDLTGDIVQAGILGYLAQVDISDSLNARTAGDVTVYRLPSYGRFLTAVQPHYFFGVARAVSFPGVMMDVDYLRYHVVANDDSRAASVQFMRQAGVADSAAENGVPELMFRIPNLAVNDPGQPQGMSAVKALAIAAAQGQKIYTLNQSNHVMHGAILQGLQIDEDVKLEISNALATGKEVTVHEKDLRVSGWVGSGYIILDPDSGVGAYKISGGANGAVLYLLGLLLIVLVLVVVVEAIPIVVIGGAAATMSAGLAGALSMLAGVATALGAASIYGYDLLASRFQPAIAAFALAVVGFSLSGPALLITIVAGLLAGIAALL